MFVLRDPFLYKFEVLEKCCVVCGVCCVCVVCLCVCCMCVCVCVVCVCVLCYDSDAIGE